MEKVYLKRMEARPDEQSRTVGGGGMNMGRGSGLDMQRSAKRRHDDVKGPDRETIIAITDDPGVIHRGEILPFETRQNIKSKR